jgi:hypothetical protein
MSVTLVAGMVWTIEGSSFCTIHYFKVATAEAALKATLSTDSHTTSALSIVFLIGQSWGLARLDTILTTPRKTFLT